MHSVNDLFAEQDKEQAEIRQELETNRDHDEEEEERKYDSEERSTSPTHLDQEAQQQHHDSTTHIIPKKNKKKKKKKHRNTLGELSHSDHVAHQDASSSSSSDQQHRDHQPFTFPDEGQRISSVDLENGVHTVNGDVLPDAKTPFDPDQVDWSDDNHEDEGEETISAEDRNFCGDCHHNQNEQEKEGNPNAMEHTKHFLENICDTDRKRLAIQAQQVYNHHVQRHSSDRRVYSARMLLEHHEKHAPTPQTLQARDFRYYENVLNVIRKRKTFSKSLDGTEDIDSSSVRLYMSVSTRRDTVAKELFATVKRAKDRLAGGGEKPPNG
jgi:hypothetical protein